MSRETVYTAIDLGTEKCVTIISTLDPHSRELKVVGISVVPSKGIRKSVIVDLEQVINTVSQSLDGAERMAGFEVKSAYLSVAGGHVTSRNSKGVVAVASPEQEITQQDVDRVIEAARAVALPVDTQIIHVIPRDFKVDSQEGVKDPVGMAGVRLESEAHIITGMTTSLKNMEKCLGDLGLRVDDFVFAGLASAGVVLTETEQELGVVVVDIGSGSTSLCVYVEGSLQYSGSLPVGARHITRDIASGCRISLEDAEAVKLALSQEGYSAITPLPGESKEDLAKRRKKADKLDPTKIGLKGVTEPLSKRAAVESIMQPRIKEIFELIRRKLREEGLFEKVPAGVVICGGGAETVQIVDMAKRVLQLPARLGQPTELKGLTQDIIRPAFATSIGLLMYGKSHGVGQQVGRKLRLRSLKPKLDFSGALGKLKSLVKSLLP